MRQLKSVRSNTNKVRLAFLKMIGKIALLTFIICSLSKSSSAQGVVTDFLPNARSIGLGWSAVACPNDPTAAYWNPASLAFLTDDKMLININDNSHFDLTGVSKFFPPKIGFAINVYHSLLSDSKYNLSTLACGYRINSALAVGGNINLGRGDSGEFVSSFGLGIFLKSYPDYRSSTITANPAWRWFRSKKLQDKINFGLTFHNFPLYQTKNTQQLRAALALKLYHKVPTLHVAYHLSRTNYNFHFGAQISLLKNIHLYTGVIDFDKHKFAFGNMTQVGPFIVELSYAPDRRQYYCSLYLTFSENKLDFAQKHKNQGAAYVKQNDFRNGLKEYEKALAYDPDDNKLNYFISVLADRVDQRQARVDSLVKEAKKVEKKGWYEIAFYNYKQILTIDPQHKYTLKHLRSISPKVDERLEKLYQQAITSYGSNELTKAEKLINQVLAINEAHRGAMACKAKIDSIKQYNFDQNYLRGIGYFNQANYIRAEEEFIKALEIFPQHEKALEYKQLIDNILEKKQQRIERLLVEAASYEKANLIIQANNKYQQVLSLDRNNESAKEKINYYKKYISTVVESRFQTAKQLFEKNEYGPSISILKEILAMDPSHPPSKNYLRLAQQGLKNAVDSHFKLAQAYYRQGKWNEASDECNLVLALDNNYEAAKSLQLDISNHVSLQHLQEEALRFYESKNYRRAMETYHQILARAPADKAAKEYLRNCEKEILALIEELFNQGMVSYSEGDYQEAITIWTSILELDPNHKRSLEYIQKANERLKILSAIK